VSAFKVGDTVYVDDGDQPGNFSGKGVVTAVRGNWYAVKGEWGDFEFLAYRVRLLEEEDVLDPTLKQTNPKDAIGSDKLPLHLWPETATAMGTLGLLDGALKYGRNNWRETGVRATIYVDALKRHVNAYAEGEDLDPDSKMPHLAHALADLAILVDADAAGKLNDDRNYPGGYRSLVEELTPLVKQIKERHADKSPRHWTIADV
jgi:hypothetical protein